MGLLFIMAFFELKIQQKVSVWQECVVTVHADTLELAVEKLAKLGSMDSVLVDYTKNDIDHMCSGFTQTDTEEELTPKDNGGMATFEVWLGEELLHNNGEDNGE
jgi:hypothetical protein